MRNLEVLDILKGAAGKHKKYVCKCLDCDKIFNIDSHNYKKGKGCACKKHLYNDLSGKDIGKLKILKIEALNSDIPKNLGHLYLCKCNFCKKEYSYHCSIISRKGFKGCRCNTSDINLSAKNRLFAVYRHNANKRNLPFEITFEHFISLCSSDCFYCGDSPYKESTAKDIIGSFTYNGIDRFDNSKGYIVGNIVPCCSICNNMKKNSSFKDFINQIIKINKKHE